MARKPVNLTAIDNYLTPRDQVWASIRKLREFSIADLESDSGVNRETVKSYVNGLQKAGYLVITGKDNRRSNRLYTQRNLLLGQLFKLEKDTGVDAPRVTATGEPVTQGDKRRRIWQSIRILHKGFTFQEIISAASTDTSPVSQEDVRRYVQFLAKAKYLKKLGPGRPARYMLLPGKNTGPKAPMIQRNKDVFDPNKNTVVYTREGGAQ